MRTSLHFWLLWAGIPLTMSCSLQFDNERKAECASLADCNEGQICRDGRCMTDNDGCHASRPCPNAQLCVRRVCIVPCSEDSECDGNGICIVGRCETDFPCTSDAMCDAGSNGQERYCLDGACLSGSPPTTGGQIAEPVGGQQLTGGFDMQLPVAGLASTGGTDIGGRDQAGGDIGTGGTGGTGGSEPIIESQPSGVFNTQADCFVDNVDHFLEVPGDGSAYVPTAACSSFGLSWTRADQVGHTLNLVASPEQAGPINLGPVDGGRFVFQDNVLLIPRVNNREGGVVNIWTVDLNLEPLSTDASEAANQIARLGQFVYPIGLRQGEVTRGLDFTAFVEAQPTGLSQVVIVDDDGNRLNCGLPFRSQWGVVAGPDWVAWFEQRTGSRRARVVTVASDYCNEPNLRRERLLSGVIEAGQRLERVDAQLFWLERLEESDVNRLMAWSFQDLAEEPTAIDVSTLNDGNPVEFAAGEEDLAVVTYRSTQPRYVLWLYEIANGNGRNVEQSDNARRPAFSKHHLMWAEQGADSSWSIRYENLEEE